MKPAAIADLHCDLLDYLHRNPEASPYDPDPRCSLPHLMEGGVVFQVLAMFGQTGVGSSRIGLSQSHVFEKLAEEHAEKIVPVRGTPEIRALPPGRTGVIAAIENASVFCEEDEALEAGLKRFEEIRTRVGRVLYVTLTWHYENRFGGGNDSRAGLKDDGRTFLEYLSGRKIALDFSHMSPLLAREALDFIDRRGLEIPVLASHSCFAAIVDIPRNLPDDVALQIVERGGVIGLNFVRRFLGENDGSFAEHLRHALELGAEKHACFGADFFSSDGIDPEYQRLQAPQGFFFPGFDNAGCYPRLLEKLGEEVPCSDDLLLDLAHRNLYRFLDRLA